MSADTRWLSKVIPEGNGLALDLGGGQGGLHMLIERKGWQYVNADLRPSRNGFAVCADAHRLPFREGCL